MIIRQHLTLKKLCIEVVLFICEASEDVSEYMQINDILQ